MITIKSTARNRQAGNYLLEGWISFGNQKSSEVKRLGAIVAQLIEVSFLDSALGINDRFAGYACSYPHLENSEVV